MERNEIVAELRKLSTEIQDGNHGVLFPGPEPGGEFADECPFVDKACEAIEHGGRIGATSLGSLVYHIANMMEE